MDLRELKQRISKLTDEQLIEMVTTESGDYRQEALDYAKSELRSRGVDWSQPEVEAEEPITEDVEPRPAPAPIGGSRSSCHVCGGQLRPGTLVAEKELTIVFDNQEERFIRAMACARCGQLFSVVDYETDVER
jgi:hypothetical protein